VRPVSARALVDRLLPIARRGLVDAGVEPAEAERWLAIVARRAERGRTGATWQRQVFDACVRAGARAPEACHHLLESYLAAAAGGAPVHAWAMP
jgi:hypothetical protein